MGIDSIKPASPKEILVVTSKTLDNFRDLLLLEFSTAKSVLHRKIICSSAVALKNHSWNEKQNTVFKILANSKRFLAISERVPVRTKHIFYLTNNMFSHQVIPSFVRYNLFWNIGCGSSASSKQLVSRCLASWPVKLEKISGSEWQVSAQFWGSRSSPSSVSMIHIYFTRNPENQKWGLCKKTSTMTLTRN